MEREEYSVGGIGLGAYSPAGNKSYSPDDIEGFLKRFQLHEALKLLGELSHKWFFRQQGAYRRIQGIPISDYVLAYLAMRLIESSNDYRKYVMTPNDVLKAADMYWGIPDPIEVEKGHSSDSCLIRLVSNQLDYSRPIRNLLPRIFAIYRDLWPEVSKAVPIQKAIESISGLGIEDILVLCFSFSMRARTGFFRTYPDELTTDERIKDIFTRDKQQAFVDWVSCGYKKFRELSKAELKKAPGPLYDKFRFNPLVRYPAIRTDRNPKPGHLPVHLLPVPRLLLERVTRGLYFELSDYFKGSEKSNIFRTSFGYVFQEYVGALLKDAIGEKYILPELKYGKHNLDSTDWIVVQGNRGILIEVKQSGLFLNAKTWGDLESIKQDLSKTVGKGVKQLWAFEQAIHSGRHEELKHLSHIKEVERIIVTHDRSYLSNSILRDQIWKKFSEDKADVPKDFHWHLISIDELEDLLGMRDLILFDLLRKKRLDPDDDEMDFGDYLGRKYADRYSPNAYLNRINEEFFSKFK
ncbi:MAG TPA: hypothetical protein VF528_13360 [Pyrinomonadaceae bacterium]|jgi:hypothetical protein